MAQAVRESDAARRTLSGLLSQRQPAPPRPVLQTSPEARIAFRTPDLVCEVEGVQRREGCPPRCRDEKNAPQKTVFATDHEKRQEEDECRESDRCHSPSADLGGTPVDGLSKCHASPIHRGPILSAGWPGRRPFPKIPERHSEGSAGGPPAPATRPLFAGGDVPDLQLTRIVGGRHTGRGQQPSVRAEGHERDRLGSLEGGSLLACGRIPEPDGLVVAR